MTRKQRPTFMARSALGAVAILFLLMIARLGAADGGFFGKDVGVNLTIPDQRAIIVWDEGHETLFVESKLRAQAGDYSWVIPLPAPPTDVGKARPSVMDLTFGELPPVVRNRDSGERFGATVILCSSLLAALVVLCWKAGPRWHRLVLLFAMPGFVFILSPAATPDIAKSAAGGGDVVRVIDRQTIGSYDVSVVKSDDALALAQWLEKAGTPLPDQAKSVIESYVKEGWCFMTARFRKEIESDASPHPIRVKFPAEKPIYPMRLTGVVSDRLDLDLVVIGKRVAECSPLRLLRSRKVVDAEPVSFGPLQESFGLQHSDIAGDVPDQALATRLRGVVSKTQMQSDYTIEWKGESPLKPQFFGQRVARDRSIAVGMAAMSAIVLLGAAIGVFRTPTRLPAYLLTLIGSGLLAGGAVGAATLAMMPTLPIEEDASRQQESEAYAIASCIQQAFVGAQTIGFDPFKVRFERGLRACARASRIKTPPAAWIKDEVGGYLMSETSKDVFEIQIMDAGGKLERMKFKDRPVKPSDPVVRTTLHIKAGPERLLNPAKRAGILDWDAMRLEFSTRSGKVYTAYSRQAGRFDIKLPAGEYWVVVKGFILNEPVTWAGRKTLKVPFQRTFAAPGEFDLSRHFFEP